MDALSELIEWALLADPVSLLDDGLWGDAQTKMRLGSADDSAGQVRDAIKESSRRLRGRNSVICQRTVNAIMNRDFFSGILRIRTCRLFVNASSFRALWNVMNHGFTSR